ncbi:hypothetical protein, partial [Bacillus cereus]
NSNVIYVDEEGLLKGESYFFAVKGAHQPFAGNAIVVGHNPDTGGDADVFGTIEYLQCMVKFISVDALRQMYMLFRTDEEVMKKLFP